MTLKIPSVDFDNFIHFKLDPQTTMKVVSLCFVCSEEVTGAWEGTIGYSPNGQKLEVDPQIENSSGKALD